MKQKKILCLFDYGEKANTGFSSQSMGIVKAIKKAYGKTVDIDIVASGYVPEEIFTMIKNGATEAELSNATEPIKCTSIYEESNGTKVMSAVWHEGAKRDFFIPYGQRDKVGRDLFFDLLEYNSEYNYDGIFIMNDMGIVQPIIPELKRIKEDFKKQGKKQFKSVYYFPIDSDFVAHINLPDFLFFDRLITYTEFGRNILHKANPIFKDNLSVISHGINLNKFYREDDTVVSEFRNEYFGENADKFIVGIINRNQFRKDIPTSIFSFIRAKEYAKENGIDIDLFLYLHCYPHDPLGHNLRMVLSQTDLVEGIDYCFPSKAITDIENKELNLIYNSLDLYLSTTLGEGFGLTAIECYATKTLTLVPDNTAYSELIGSIKKRRSIAYGMFYKVCNEKDCIIRWQGDYEEIGEMIVKIKDHEANSIINNAYEFVQSLSWDRIGKLWVEVFKIY